jgi:hypothetical protein
MHGVALNLEVSIMDTILVPGFVWSRARRPCQRAWIWKFVNPRIRQYFWSNSDIKGSSVSGIKVIEWDYWLWRDHWAGNVAFAISLASQACSFAQRVFLTQRMSLFIGNHSICFPTVILNAGPCSRSWVSQ